MHKVGSLVVLGIAAVFGLSVVAAEKPPADYQNAMKAIGAAVGALQKAVPAKDYDAVEKSAAAAKAQFGGVVEQYWKTKTVNDAITFTATAAKAAADLEAAAKAKNDDGIAAAQKTMLGACGGCHMAHREKVEDGSFQIK